MHKWYLLLLCASSVVFHLETLHIMEVKWVVPAVSCCFKRIYRSKVHCCDLLDFLTLTRCGLKEKWGSVSAVISASKERESVCVSVCAYVCVCVSLWADHTHTDTHLPLFVFQHQTESFAYTVAASTRFPGKSLKIVLLVLNCVWICQNEHIWWAAGLL